MKKSYFVIALICGTSVVTACFVVLFYYFFSFKQTPRIAQTPSVVARPTCVEEKSENSVQSSVHVPILIYHNVRPIESSDSAASRQFIVTPDEFERQLAYLKDNGFAVVSFDQLINALQGKTVLPPQSVILTFDDGTKNQFDNAVPLLAVQGFTATFFVFTNAMDQNPNYMTWDNLRVLSDQGMTIGSHTVLHPYLNRMTDRDQLVREITKSKQDIEEHLNKPALYFSYPFGAYDNAIEEMVKSAGYIAARDIVNGSDHTTKDLFSLHAWFVTNDFERFVGIIAQE